MEEFAISASVLRSVWKVRRCANVEESGRTLSKNVSSEN